jgi:LPS export ABC transporter protein LptC
VVLILHTRVLSRAILLGVVLFVAAIVTMLVAKGRTTRPEVVEPEPTKADYRVKEVQLREEGRGGTKWQLDAAQAETFEQSGKTILKKVRIGIEQGGQTWTVTGDEAEMARGNKDWELRGNVVLVSSDGLRLETTRLQWEGDQQRAWTDEPVTVYRPGAVVKGRGLEAFVDKQITTIKGRVRAVFDAKTRS